MVPRPAGAPLRPFGIGGVLRAARRWALPVVLGPLGCGDAAPDLSGGLRGTWLGTLETHSVGTSETAGSAPLTLPEVNTQADHTLSVEDHTGRFSSEDGSILAVVLGGPCSPLEVHGHPGELSTHNVSCADQTLDPAGTRTVVRTQVDRLTLRRTGPGRLRLTAELREEEDRTSSEGTPLLTRRVHTTLSMDAERL